MHRISRACPVLLIAAIQSASAQSTQSPATPGSFNVGPDGSARFSVPIRLPSVPGALGLNLILAYDSSQQDGDLMGQGWTLQGLSKITICPRTVLQDGLSEGAAYNLTDRYCLDGARLIAVKGTYGADATEYRTERDSFARIISYGNYQQSSYPAYQGPHHFIVQTKDGRTMEFGNTSDSRVMPIPSAYSVPIVRAWALNKSTDATGNYYTVAYSNQSSYNVNHSVARDDGVFYPIEIDFAANNSGSTAKYSVAFGYTGNGGDQYLYSSGRPTFRDRVLTSITVANLNPNAPLVPTTYTINYVPNNTRPSSKDEQRVSSISMYTPPGGSFTPIQFTWNTENTYVPFATTTIDSAFPGTASDYDDYFADLNGTGKKSWIRISRSTDEAWIGTAGNDGIFTASSWTKLTQSVGKGNDYVHAFADIDGDGKADWIRISKTNSLGWVATGLGQGAFQFWTTSNLSVGSASQYDHLFADLNGDGRADWIRISKVADEIAMAKSSGGGNFDFWTKTVSRGLTWITSWKQSVADLTATGKLDLISYGCSPAYGGYVTRHFNFSGFVGGWATSATCDSRDQILFADLNGDGAADLVKIAPPDPNGASSADQTQGSIRVALGDGNHSFSNNSFPGGLMQPAYIPYKSDIESMVIDVRGDGLQHLLQFHSAYAPYRITDSGDAWRLVDHQQASVIEQNLPSAPRGTVTNFAADLNGDGMEDLVEVTRGTNMATVRNAAGQLPKRITAIATDLGNTINITYKPLSDPSVYSADTDATFPIMDVKGTRIDKVSLAQSRLQRSMMVVSNVTTNDGIGGTLNTKYTYGGLKGELSGHGLTGFRWSKATQVESAVIAETDYRQDWPYSGLTSLTKKMVGSESGLFEKIEITYGCNDFTSATGCTVAIGQHYFPYPSQKVTSAWDLNGASLPTQNTLMEYDSFGNLAKATIIWSTGQAKTVQTDYSNDTTKWWIGRPAKTTTTNFIP